jgi:L-lysine 6-transaminase
MVRSRRLLEIIEAEGLVETAGPKGEHLLAGLREVAHAHRQLDNVRGRGLFAACDLTTAKLRDAVVADLHDVEHVIVLPCGERSIRFRPALSITEDELDEAVAALGRSLARVSPSGA